jgi:hypothetical protein
VDRATAISGAGEHEASGFHHINAKAPAGIAKSRLIACLLVYACAQSWTRIPSCESFWYRNAGIVLI